MRHALTNLDASLARVRDVMSEMDLHALAPAPVILRNETLRCACTVVLSGFLESFLKDVARAYITEISRRRLPFDDLPTKVKRRHFAEGSNVLNLKVRKPGRVAWVDADPSDIAIRLASPALRSSSYQLLWEAFADTQANPGPLEIEQLLEGLGVENRQPRLNAALGGTYATQRLALKSFVDVRNECAHTGSATKIPTTSDIRGYCDIIFAVASAVIRVLEDNLRSSGLTLDLNRASARELKLLPGLGRSRAIALARHRALTGPFTSVEDLLSIRGFGSAVVDAIRPFVHVK